MVEYIVAIDVTRVRFPADALSDEWGCWVFEFKVKRMVVTSEDYINRFRGRELNPGLLRDREKY